MNLTIYIHDVFTFPLRAATALWLLLGEIIHRTFAEEEPQGWAFLDVALHITHGHRELFFNRFCGNRSECIHKRLCCIGIPCVLVFVNEISSLPESKTEPNWGSSLTPSSLWAGGGTRRDLLTELANYQQSSDGWAQNLIIPFRGRFENHSRTI